MLRNNGDTMLLFMLYTISSVSGLILLKSRIPLMLSDLKQGIVWGRASFESGFGGLLYLFSFILWLLILSKEPISWAYPLAFGLTALGVAITSVILLNEDLGWSRLIGACLIGFGIVFLVSEKF